MAALEEPPLEGEALEGESAVLLSAETSLQKVLAQPSARSTFRNNLLPAARRRLGAAVFGSLALLGLAALLALSQSGRQQAEEGVRLEVSDAGLPKTFPFQLLTAQVTKCGFMEEGLDYVVEGASWSERREGIKTAHHCCAQCRGSFKCKAWTWVKASSSCVLKGSLPSRRPPNDGVTSGLPERPGRDFASLAPTVAPPTAPPPPAAARPAAVAAAARPAAAAAAGPRPAKPAQAATQHQPPSTAQPPKPVHHFCGPPEVGKAYVVKCNWTTHLDHVPTAKACQTKCGSTEACRSWTWIKDAKAPGPGPPSQCILLGGSPSLTQPNDGVISGRCGRQPPRPRKPAAPAKTAAAKGPAPAEADAASDEDEEEGPEPDLRAPEAQAMEGWHPDCSSGPIPALPVADVAGAPLVAKVLTYNLYWWNLIDIEKGLGGSPFRLINGSMAPPYDVMGFQECQDPHYVLQQAGLAGMYQVLLGEMAICMAFRKDTWTLLSSGQANVAEDRQDQYFGLRAAQWIRLRHKRQGKVLFFMNHHGPTPVNTGGYCGGSSTAVQLVRLIASNAQPGDAVVLSGDFNAGSGSGIINLLRQRMEELFCGSVDGGIDHVFANLVASSVVKTANLGKGGSDHDALQVLVHLSGPGAAARPATPAAPALPPGPGAPAAPGVRPAPPGPAAPAAAPAATTAAPAAPAAPPAAATAAPAAATQAPTTPPAPTEAPAAPVAPPPMQCKVEHNTDYVIQSGWGFHFDHVPSAAVCCHRCNVVSECKAWVWVPAGGLNQCWLKGGLPVSRVAKPGVIAGLPVRAQGRPVGSEAEAAAFRRYGQKEMATRSRLGGAANAPPGNPVMFLSKERQVLTEKAAMQTPAPGVGPQAAAG